jgi:ribosomal protein S18 acetylase RimI-like enzyme
VGNQPVTVTRVSPTQWHALDDDLVVGRGNVSRRPDGRDFVSIDAWHDTVFDRLATAMLTDLPAPVYTVADESDLDLVPAWRRNGFTVARREWEYLARTGGPGPVPPDGIRILPAGTADEDRLRQLYQAIRTEVGATVGWSAMPAEVLARPDGSPLLDPSRYAVAAGADRYAGLVRVVARRRHARIGLVAVRAEHRRAGTGRALLAHVLDSLRRAGVDTASAEVDERNAAAVALFEGAGAQRVGSTLELVHH